MHIEVANEDVLPMRNKWEAEQTVQRFASRTCLIERIIGSPAVFSRIGNEMETYFFGTVMSYTFVAFFCPVLFHTSTWISIFYEDLFDRRSFVGLRPIWADLSCSFSLFLCLS